MHPLKNILNGFRWDPRRNPADYEIIFIHRGAPGDVKTVAVVDVKKVGNSWFTYSRDQEEETLIPFHRVVEMRNRKTGHATWRRGKHVSLAKR